MKLSKRLEERRELPQCGSGQSPGRKLISVLSKCQIMLLVEMFVVDWRRRLLIEKNMHLVVWGNRPLPLDPPLVLYTSMVFSVITVWLHLEWNLMW